MKKLTCTLLILACLKLSNAQVPLLWGMTSKGGANGSGTIFNILGDGSSFTHLYSLPSYTVSLPNGNLTLASDGKLYGVTYSGGLNGIGTIYSVDTNNSSVTVVYNFSSGGMQPAGSLVAASNGILYGICCWSDSARACIYSFDPVNLQYTTLKYLPIGHTLKCGSLMQASNGLLYGITTFAGSYQIGAVISYDITSNVLSVLHDFDFTTGQNPIGNGLIEAGGKLYGMTADGGISDKGVIFSYDIIGNTFLKIVDFTGPNGSHPEGSLAMATNGLLYGATSSGGLNHAGVIFSVDPISNIFTVIHNLDFTSGGKPYGSFYPGASGLLYGMTHVGGANKHGVIFSFDPITSNYQILYDFQNTNGEFPNGSLVEIGNKLYGFTSNGGLIGCGTVFSFNTSNGTFSSLYDLPVGPLLNGWHYQGGITQAIDGKLYGICQLGGANQNGYIFSYDPTSQEFEKWFDFHESDIEQPVRDFVQCSNGKLYALSSYGGNNNGSIYCLDPILHELKLVHHFDFVNGAQPTGSLVELSNGKLYGTTRGGGVMLGPGVLFDFDPSIDSLTNLYEFDFATGVVPDAGKLAQAGNGKLYGFTSWGGNNAVGGIFSFDLTNSSYTYIHDFNGNDGAWITGSFTKSNNGNLYAQIGTSAMPDVHIIKVDPSTDSYSQEYTFNTNGLEGGRPYGSFVNGSDGLLYAMASYYGAFNNGIIYRYDPSQNVYTKIHDFDGAYGASPYGDLIELTMPLSIDKNENTIEKIIVLPNPTTGMFSIINTQFAIDGVEILNTLGEKVMPALISFGNKEIKVDISQLPSGIYILQAISGDKILRGKVLKK